MRRYVPVSKADLYTKFKFAVARSWQADRARGVHKYVTGVRMRYSQHGCGQKDEVYSDKFKLRIRLTVRNNN